VRYYVTLGADRRSQPTVVDLVELPNGTLQARVDGRPIDLEVVPVGKQLNVRADGHVIDLTAYGAPPEFDVSARGYRARVRVESERTYSAELPGNEAGSGEKVVKSPMPGRVVKVLVVKGEAVKAGQGLVVLEAMKMENEVRARAAGTVAEVHVIVGATVEGSATLVTLA
jgi:biotin carboxyl carrier protein